MIDVSSVLLWAVVTFASYYLLKQVYIRLFLSFDDDVVTIVGTPFVDRPPIDKITKMHLLDAENVQKHGPVIRFVNSIKPWDVTLLISEPNLIRELFVGVDWKLWERAHYTGESHAAYTKGIISASNGELWRDTRALFERTFHTVAVRKYTPLLLDLRTVLIEQLEKANDENPQGFDIFPRFHRFTFDTITRLTFGVAVNAQTTPEGALLAAKFDAWLEAGGLLGAIHAMLGKWAWALVPKIVAQQKDADETMFGLLKKEAERIRSGEKRVSIMDEVYEKGGLDFALEEILDGTLPSTINEEHLHYALMSVLFAGHDTTAALLSFLTYELSKRPDLQRLIREEVEEANGPGDLVNLEVLEKCKVLNACIKESLRLRPSAPYGGGRTAFQDFEVAYTDVEGKPKRIQVTKGSMILPGLHAMQHYPKYWNKDPSVFAPERFYEDVNGGAVNMWTQSPFGQGARRCVGERLALGEARLGIASILRKFQVEQAPREGWTFEEVFAGTIKPNNVFVKLRKIGK